MNEERTFDQEKGDEDLVEIEIRKITLKQLENVPGVDDSLRISFLISIMKTKSRYNK